MAHDRHGKHSRPPGARSTAEVVKRREALLKTGKFIDMTEEALKHGLGGILLTGVPEPPGTDREKHG